MRRWRKLRRAADIMRTCAVVMYAVTMRCADMLRKQVWLLVLVLVVIVLALLYSRLDPCQGRTILASICKESAGGEISGQLCSALCREQSIYLTYCLEDGHTKSFLWANMVMRVPAHHGQKDLTLVEGMLPSEFHTLVVQHLQRQLGPGDFISLTRRLKHFADFNEDGKLSLGEAQSLWRLLHSQEFLVLFMFQHSYVFPALNGTCGSLFGYTYPQVPVIYSKNTFPLHLLSQTAYRWSLPDWEKRAKVGVGMLDLMFDIYEEDHIKFFVCDLQPTSLGHSDMYEAVLTRLSEVKSGAMLVAALENRTCSQDHECHYSPYCTTVCDASRGRCTGEVTKPTLWQACHLLTEYLLFDTPLAIRPTLESLLHRCSHLIIYGQSIDMSHVVLITDLKAILWNHIKNQNV